MAAESLTISARPRRGRPRWIPSEEELKKVETAASHGLTLERIARLLGIGLATLKRRRRDYELLDTAIKKGAAIGEEVVAGALFGAAKSGNTVAMIFYLKARCGWRENIQLKVEDEREAREAEERERQFAVIRAMTQEERKLYIDILRRAEARVREKRNTGKADSCELASSGSHAA